MNDETLEPCPVCKKPGCFWTIGMNQFYSCDDGDCDVPTFDTAEEWNKFASDGILAYNPPTPQQPTYTFKPAKYLPGKGFPILLGQNYYPIQRILAHSLDEAKKQIDALREAKEICKSCEWSSNRYGECWDTQCGQSQYFVNGTLQENRYKFCPYCGGKIVTMEE